MRGALRRCLQQREQGTRTHLWGGGLGGPIAATPTMMSVSKPAVVSSRSFDAVCALVNLSHPQAVSVPSSERLPRPGAALATTGQRSAVKPRRAVPYHPSKRLPPSQRPLMSPPVRARATGHVPLRPRTQWQWHHSVLSQRVQGKHQLWQAMLKAEMSHAPHATRALCDPATRLNPIDTMLLLRQLQPEQVASLSPPAVARLVATFRERAETLVFANPVLREALSQTASV